MLLPTRSTWVHLRIKYSFFLLAIVFYAFSITPLVSYVDFGILLLVLGVGIFPSSQGYNSYFDRDEGSVGGLEAPPKVTQDLYWVSILFESVGLFVSLFCFGKEVFLLLFVYGIFSKLYSHPSTRLKARPYLGWITVILFQGPVIFLATRLALSPEVRGNLKYLYRPEMLVPMGISALIMSGSYPLTQIYQHEEDAKRGDHTLSRMLGIQGTFIFSGVSYLLASVFLLWQWGFSGMAAFAAVMMFPSMLFFVKWYQKVKKDHQLADFKHLHQFLKLSSGSVTFMFLAQHFWRSLQ